MKTPQAARYKEQLCPECGKTALRRGRQCPGCKLEWFVEGDCVTCELDTELVDYCPRCDYIKKVGKNDC